jgi:uncharacterized protein YacL
MNTGTIEPRRHLGRRHGPLHWLAVVVGIAGGFLLGVALLKLSGVRHAGYQEYALLGLTAAEGGLFAYLTLPYLVRWWRDLDRLLKTTPLEYLLTGVVGMVAGLIVAVLIANFVRDFPFGVPLSAILAALLAFLGASVGMHRRGELMRLAGVAGGDGAPRRLRKVLLDTSVIIDGRILEVVQTGFLDAPLVITRSVLKELQLVADSADPIRRARGRRGLEVLTQVQAVPQVELEFLEDELTPDLDIDLRLVELGRRHGWAVMTNDYNLNRVAQLEGVQVLNLNELAGAMRPVAIPGEELTVALVREGKEPGQGVGYLDDGTMVVVENGRRLVNQTVTATVVSVLQTAAGRMLFAQLGAATEERKGRQAVP